MARAKKPDEKAADKRIDRNGICGEYEAFAPVKMTIDQILARALNRMPQPAEIEITSKTLTDIGAYSLVRYKLKSDQYEADLASLGLATRMPDLLDRHDMTVMLGIVDRETNEVQMAIDIIDDHSDRGPQIFSIFLRETFSVPNEVLGQFLQYIDIPPSWRSGMDHHIAEKFDFWYDKDSATWQHRAPQEVISVTFERLNFSTSPTLTERIDITVLADPEWDLRSEDKDHAYWAKDFYRQQAWTVFHRIPKTDRRGFSSWLNPGEPQIIKVVGDAFDHELSALQTNQPICGVIPGRPHEDDDLDEGISSPKM